MSELIPIFLVSMVLAYLSHHISVYDPMKQNYERKERFFLIIMTFFMVLFIGLRTDYNDTTTYRRIYELIPADVDLFAGIDWLALGDNPGFVFTNRLLVKLGFSTQSYIMFYAIITTSIYAWFIHKYTSNIWLSFFLMFTMGIFTFPLAAIKQCTAMAFCILATDRAIRKKHVSFVIFTLIASTFHAYALMYFIVPFLFFRPWSSMTYLMMIATVIIAVSLQSLLGTVLNITDMLGEGYDENSFTGEGINIFRLAVHMVPVLISYLVRPSLAERNDRTNNLITNLATVNAAIMFVGLFGTANYFGRLANYFQIFQCISLVWLFTHLDRKSRQPFIILSCSCYLLYFIYTYSIHESFDGGYKAVKFWDYIESLIYG